MDNFRAHKDSRLGHEPNFTTSRVATPKVACKIALYLVATVTHPIAIETHYKRQYGLNDLATTDALHCRFPNQLYAICQIVEFGQLETNDAPLRGLLLRVIAGNAVSVLDTPTMTIDAFIAVS